MFLGKISLWIALICLLIQVSHCMPAKRRLVAAGAGLSLFISLLSLVFAHVTNDFSLVNVFEHSHTSKPLFYKITGVWGNHEGSMLLLVLLTAGYHVWAAFHKNINQKVIQLHALILIAFLSFLMFTSSPFVAMDVVVTEGLGQNPLLQDVGLAIHPPLLYIGYAGLSLIFCYAIVEFVENRLDEKWVEMQLRLALFVWIFLTIGISLGSWWAYRELGWGGYWFWDPVENVSLMPWLICTALIHSLLVLQAKRRLKSMTIILSLTGFILSLLGIFLVRSGILTSVHAFAQDPGRGLYVLGFIALVTIGSLAIYGKYSNIHRATSSERACFREIMILLNNMLLIGFCACVLLGTLYPLVMQMVLDESVTVAAPYFSQMLQIFIFPFIILAIGVPLVNWQGSVPVQTLLWYAPTLPIAGLIAWYNDQVYILAILGWWLVMLSAWQGIKHYKKWQRIWAMALAHAGLGLMVVSMTVLAYQTKETQVMLGYGESIEIARYKVTLDKMMVYMRHNYMLREGVVSIYSEGQKQTVIHPQVRYYPVQQQNTTEAAIYRDGLSDLYVVLGQTNGADSFGLRIYYRPMINGIWLSVGMLVVAGIFAMIRKRK